MPMTFGFIGGSGGSGVRYSYWGSGNFGANSPTYKFALVGYIGPATSTRYVIVGVTSEAASSPYSAPIQSVYVQDTTMSGRTGVALSNIISNGDNRYPVAIYGGVVPTWDYVNIRVEFTANVKGLVVGAYTMDNYLSTTPVGTAIATSTPQSIKVAKGGLLVSMSQPGDANDIITWTNLNENFTLNLSDTSNFNASGASIRTGADNNSYLFSNDGSTFEDYTVAASWA